MKRIIGHWTAGGPKANASDRKHYHIIIEQDGTVVQGDHPISANAAPVRKGAYAAHTLNANSDSIGVAMAGMHMAKDKPFDPGRHPLRAVQVDAYVREIARLCRAYRIPVTRETVLTHAEVQPTLGIRQRGKWDISWLPGMSAPADPVRVGDGLRERVRQAMQPAPAPVAPPAVETPPVGFWAALWAMIFGGRK